MSTRFKVRIVSFIAALFLILGGTTVMQYKQIENYKRDLYYDYSEALMGLNTNLENLSICLEKTLYATSPKLLSTLAGEIMHETSSAKNFLARIPIKETAFTNLNKFLNQSGGFSYLLMAKAAEGGTITTEETKTLKSLSEVANKLSLAITEGEASYNYIEAFENLKLPETDEQTLNNLLEETEESLGSYPTLIYDGPFSDHLLEKEPLLIKEMANVSESQAKNNAAAALDININDIKLVGTEEGLMPSYKFEYSAGTVAVTKRGGVIVYFLKNREISTETISYEDAVLKAEEYLKTHTDYTFKSSYYFVENGICTINFSYYSGGVIHYTDLLKVQVALDNGEIIGLEARGFIANHKPRENLTPKISLEKAKTALSKNLTVSETALSLIPTNNGGEALCYEFLVKGTDNKDIIIFVNANTGLEEDILILLKTDGGSLTK